MTWQGGRKEVRIKKAKTLVIGLGEIGYNNCEYMSLHGLNVDGYDINDKAVQHALNVGVIKKKATNFQGYDYYVICVSTHSPKKTSSPSFKSFFDVINKLSSEGSEGSLIIIESTITKGLSNKIKTMLNHRLHVAHAPHRFYANEKTIHGINQMRVLGGCEPCCTQEALHFYKDLLGIPMQTVDDIEIAELSKVVENAYRMVQIAFAEELKMFCDSNHIDFNVLRTAINSKWNINILEARDGINGHCLPKDSQMYITLVKDTVPFSIAYSAKIVDQLYKLKIANKLKKKNFITQKVIT